MILDISYLVEMYMPCCVALVSYGVHNIDVLVITGTLFVSFLLYDGRVLAWQVEL